jgi:uncharacterized membrane protein (UPF0127 family)
MMILRYFPVRILPSWRRRAAWVLLPWLMLMASVQAAEISAHLGDHTLQLELALDEPSRMHGLMFREHLAPDHGMLFVFDDEREREFWMKNTLIPLDLLFFDAKGRLIAMQLNAQPCRQPRCPGYPSNQPARYVLELNAGSAQQLHLQLGEQLQAPGLVPQTP